MEVNFNIIVITITLLVYIILRYIKYYDKTTIITNKDKDKDKDSNLIYIIYIPISLYLGKYFYEYKFSDAYKIKIESNNSIHSNSDLLTEPYPVTTTD